MLYYFYLVSYFNLSSTQDNLRKPSLMFSSKHPNAELRTPNSELKSFYPLTAPAVSPSTILLWKNKTNKTRGKVPKTVAAAMGP